MSEAQRPRSAGVVVTRSFAGATRFLLLRAFRYWDFPKDEVQSGEQPLAAALREVAEETGLRDLEFAWGEGYCDTPPYARGKIARYYLARSPGEEVCLGVSPVLGRPEHHEFRWLDYPGARSLLVARVAAVLDWAQAVLAAGHLR